MTGLPAWFWSLGDLPHGASFVIPGERATTASHPTWNHQLDSSPGSWVVEWQTGDRATSLQAGWFASGASHAAMRRVVPPASWRAARRAAEASSPALSR